MAERLARAKAAYPKKAVATFCPLPLPGACLGMGACVGWVHRSNTAAADHQHTTPTQPTTNNRPSKTVAGTEDNPDGPEPRLPRRLWARLVASADLGGGEQEDGDAGVTWGAASPKALALLAERVKGFVVDTAGKGAFKVRGLCMLGSENWRFCWSVLALLISTAIRANTTNNRTSSSLREESVWGNWTSSPCSPSSYRACLWPGRPRTTMA